jgi:hypothetical protein
MFESLELRKAQNGIIVTIKTEEGEDVEYVFDNIRKALKFTREYFEGKTSEPA